MGLAGLVMGCDFPLWMRYYLVIYMLSFLALFGNFYVKAYRGGNFAKNAGGKRKTKTMKNEVALDKKIN